MRRGEETEQAGTDRPNGTRGRLAADRQVLIGDLTWLPWGLLQAVLAWNAGDGPAARRGWRLVGRATSAFPGALPPQRIRRVDARAARLEGILPDREREDFWFSDGGILMNKPFKPVVKTIFQRSATRPVERVLLFLDPHPPALKPQPKTAAQEPHILEVISAPVNLPHNEDVAVYLEEVQQQNAFRRRMRRRVPWPATA